MIYRILHRTRYRYSDSVTRSVHVAHLRPRALAHQELLDYTLDLSPQPHEASRAQDYYGNPVDFFVIEGPHQTLKIESTSTIQVRPRPNHDASAAAWETVPATLIEDRSRNSLRIREFQSETSRTPRLAAAIEYARASFLPGRPLKEAALELTNRVHAEFEFDPKATTVSTPITDVFRRKRGVCQDFAHFLIAALRGLNLPARYVSGYLRTVPPPGRPRLRGVDASHAWVAVYCPPSGWLELDPTNNRVADEDYVTLGWGRDYDDVSLIRGVVDGGGRHTLRLSVDVTEIDETSNTPIATT